MVVSCRPALEIKMNKGGDKTLIFDPSIYDGPVSIKEWCKPIIVKHPAATRIILSKPDKYPRGFQDKNLVNLEAAWPERLEEAYDEFKRFGFCIKEHEVFQSSLRQSFNPLAKKMAGKPEVKARPFKGNHKRIKPKPIYLDEV